MKIPTLDKTESILVIAVAAFAAYVAYRAYKTGSGIADNVSKGVTNAAHGVMNAANRLRYQGAPMHPNTMDNRDVGIDESLTEIKGPISFPTMDVNPMGDIAFSNISFGGYDGADRSTTVSTPQEIVVDPMGNVVGTGFGVDSVVENAPQNYSPSMVNLQ